jgi:tmRNA-binding protein
MAKKGKKRAPASGDVVTNRRARHKFEFVEKMEAGIVLTGSEVKALRGGQAQMTDSYAVVDDGEVWLRNSTSRPTSTRRSTPTRRIGPASCCSTVTRSSAWSAKPRRKG